MNKGVPHTQPESEVAAKARTVCIARDNDAFRKHIDILDGTPSAPLQPKWSTYRV